MAARGAQCGAIRIIACDHASSPKDKSVFVFFLDFFFEGAFAEGTEGVGSSSVVVTMRFRFVDEALDDEDEKERLGPATFFSFFLVSFSSSSFVSASFASGSGGSPRSRNMLARRAILNSPTYFDVGHSLLRALLDVSLRVGRRPGASHRRLLRLHCQAETQVVPG